MLISWFGNHLDGLILIVIRSRYLSGPPNCRRSRGLALSNHPIGLRCQLLTRRCRCYLDCLSIVDQRALLEASGFAEGCQSLRLFIDDSSASISRHSCLLIRYKRLFCLVVLLE